jgi:hypothetical protein
MAMKIARHAPSLANAQPFHLVVDPASPDSATVRFEPARGLPHSDPTGRCLFVSLGALLGSLQIALAADGRASSDELLCDDLLAPYRSHDDLDVARIRIDGPLATELRPDAQDRRHIFLRRQTNRQRYRDVPLDNDLLERLAAMPGSAVSYRSDPGLVAVVVEQASRAFLAQLRERGTRIELRRIARGGDEGAKEGLGADAFGLSPGLLQLALTLRALAASPLLRGRLMRSREGASGGGSALLWLRSPFSTAKDCVACGRALLDVWIELTAAALAFQPYGSLVADEALRDELLARIGEPAVDERGQVWLVGRVGHAPRAPESVRRDVADLVRYLPMPIVSPLIR